MTTSFTIDEGKNTIYTTVKGEITTEELIQHIARVHADPRFRKGMNTLADFSEAKASHEIDIGKIRETKEYTETIEDVRGKCKWAIFTYEEEMYAFIQMFSMLTRGMQIEVGVFRSRDEAARWLEAE